MCCRVPNLQLVHSGGKFTQLKVGSVRLEIRCVWGRGVYINKRKEGWSNQPILQWSRGPITPTMPVLYICIYTYVYREWLCVQETVGTGHPVNSLQPDRRATSHVGGTGESKKKVAYILSQIKLTKVQTTCPSFHTFILGKLTLTCATCGGLELNNFSFNCLLLSLFIIEHIP